MTSLSIHGETLGATTTLTEEPYQAQANTEKEKKNKNIFWFKTGKIPRYHMTTEHTPRHSHGLPQYYTVNMVKNQQRAFSF